MSGPCGYSINNDLRNEVYANNLLHGFWDNRRNLSQLCDNITDEICEVEVELEKYSDPSFIYYNLEKSTKPEGAPTELADIIIFVLDYFGDCYIPPEAVDLERPSTLPTPIDINPLFLKFSDESDEEYLNRKAKEYVTCDEHSPDYDIGLSDIRKMLSPSFVFSVYFKKEIEDALSLAQLYDLVESTKFERRQLDIDGEKNKDNNADGKEDCMTRTVAYQLHRVIKAVLKFCSLYNIDIDSVLRDKIAYNNTRPVGYRKLGDEELLETRHGAVCSELLANGFGAYKYTDEVVGSRTGENANMIFRRQLACKLISNRKGGR